jgi:hypothetical protein
MAAFGEAPADAPATVDWSLVGGLYDPSDEVVIRAISSLARRGVGTLAAMEVARPRLRELFDASHRGVRREVVVAAKLRPGLGISEIVDAAKGDRAWTVRREAFAAAHDDEETQAN